MLVRGRFSFNRGKCYGQTMRLFSFNRWSSMAHHGQGQPRPKGLSTTHPTLTKRKPIIEWFSHPLASRHPTLPRASEEALGAFFYKIHNRAAHQSELSLSDADLTDSQAQNLIEAVVANHQGLKNLHLNNNQLYNLPDDLANLPTLQGLYVQENKLHALPGWVGQLQQLDRILALDNEISSLSPKIGRLQRLTWLNFCNNKLEVLPEEIGYLPNLKILDLSNNKLKQLPDLHQNSSLTQLAINHNRFIQFPETVLDLPNLLHLFCSNNQIRTLPARIDKCTHLQTLNLSSNQLETLPEAFAKLQALTELQLANNRFRTLPLAVIELANLQRLDLSSNQLLSIYGGVRRLKGLQVLDLSNNNLITLPPSLFRLGTKNNGSLHTIDLRGNPIVCPIDATGLRLPSIAGYLTKQYYAKAGITCLGLEHITTCALTDAALKDFTNLCAHEYRLQHNPITGLKAFLAQQFNHLYCACDNKMAQAYIQKFAAKHCGFHPEAPGGLTPCLFSDPQGASLSAQLTWEEIQQEADDPICLSPPRP